MYVPGELLTALAHKFDGEVLFLYILPILLIIASILYFSSTRTEDRWIRLQDKAKARTQDLETAISSLSDFEQAYNRLKTWLGEKEKMMGVLGPIGVEPGILRNQKQQVEVGFGLSVNWIYSVSPSPGSDVSMQMQLVSVYTHSCFVCDLELRFANKRAKSLPGDSETEYRANLSIPLQQ